MIKKGIKTSFPSQAVSDTEKMSMEYGAKVGAAMWTPECIASLKLQGVKVDTVDDIRRNTQFTVASTMNGTGVLRPECCALFTGYDATDATPTRTDVADANNLAMDTATGYGEYTVV